MYVGMLSGLSEFLVCLLILTYPVKINTCFRYEGKTGEDSNFVVLKIPL